MPARKSTMVAAERKPRQDYTMTPEQFAYMGGQEPPEGYDPDAAEVVEVEGYASKEEKARVAQSGQFRIVRRYTQNPTRGEPPTPPPFERVQQLADEHGVRALSIVWRDSYRPDFTAVPL